MPLIDTFDVFPPWTIGSTSVPATGSVADGSADIFASMLVVRYFDCRGQGWWYLTNVLIGHGTRLVILVTVPPEIVTTPKL